MLLDFSGLLTPPGLPEVRGVAYRIAHVLDFGFERCAVVAAAEGEARVAQMFLEMCGTSFKQIRIFPDTMTAESWLAQ